MALLTLVAVLAHILASRVAAQKVTAVCTYAEWTSYKGQSPCKVWADLQAVCDPNASVAKLDTSTNLDATYPSPSGTSATACQCNVVAYNLMAGCSWCQPNVYSSNWVSESQWKAGCSSYDSTGLPSQALSVSSEIPPWALLVENGSPWFDFDASSIALAGTTPTGTAQTIPTGFATGTQFGTSLGGTGTRGAATATFTGPFSGGDDTFDDGVIQTNIGKAVGIAVGVVLGLYLVIGAIVLAVFLTRQKNRKAWYGPTAEYYRNGGRMGEAGVGQPLLGGSAHSPNPFTTPSGTPATTYTTSPYQLQSTSPPPVGQYDPNANYGQSYQSVPHTTPSPVNGQYDPNANYGQGHPQPNAYYDPNAPPMGMQNAPSSHHVPEL